MDFALNQKTAPKLGFAAFLDLAAELGCVGVEPRNDLGRPVFDGIEPARAGEMARERGLRLLGLSEVYPFNDWNDDRRAAVGRLIEPAQSEQPRSAPCWPRFCRCSMRQGSSAWWSPSASRPPPSNSSARRRRRS